MDWIETAVYTTTQGIEAVTGRLLGLGIDGFVIKDAKDFEDFLNDKDGNWDYIDDDLMGLKNCETVLVSVMNANNETGVVQPIPEISKLVHRYGGMLHTDAVQAYPHHKIDVHKCGIDFMTISGHKFGCPKGIGFVFINNLYENKISPLIYGSQERELRGGTENTPYILGLAKAVELRKIFNNPSQTDCIESKRTFFEDKLKELGCKINCENSHRLENVINCTLPDKVVGELMMYYLGFADIYVSTGSACNSRSNKPSHVLQQIGLSDDEIRRTIRISFDFDLSEKDIDKVIEVMTKYIKERKC